MIYQETEHALPSLVLAPCTSLAFRQLGLVRTTLPCPLLLRSPQLARVPNLSDVLLLRAPFIPRVLKRAQSSLGGGSLTHVCSLDALARQVRSNPHGHAPIVMRHPNLRDVMEERMRRRYREDAEQVVGDCHHGTHGLALGSESANDSLALAAPHADSPVAASRPNFSVGKRDKPAHIPLHNKFQPPAAMQSSLPSPRACIVHSRTSPHPNNPARSFHGCTRFQLLDERLSCR